jgi:hypothetical protein
MPKTMKYVEIITCNCCGIEKRDGVVGWKTTEWMLPSNRTSEIGYWCPQCHSKDFCNCGRAIPVVDPIR